MQLTICWPKLRKHLLSHVQFPCYRGPHPIQKIILQEGLVRRGQIVDDIPLVRRTVPLLVLFLYWTMERFF